MTVLASSVARSARVFWRRSLGIMATCTVWLLLVALPLFLIPSHIYILSFASLWVG